MHKLLLIGSKDPIPLKVVPAGETSGLIPAGILLQWELSQRPPAEPATPNVFWTTKHAHSNGLGHKGICFPAYGRRLIHFLSSTGIGVR